MKQFWQQQPPRNTRGQITSLHWQLWAHDVVLAAAITLERADKTAAQGVSLHAHDDELLVDGHGLVGLALTVAIVSMHHPGTIGILGGDAGGIGDTGELVRARTSIGARRNTDTRLVASVVIATRHREEIIRHGSAIRLDFGEEGALAKVVATVLLNDEVALGGVTGGKPLKAVNVLEGDLGRIGDGAIGVDTVSVGHGGLSLTVGLDALAAEHDLRGDVLLALEQSESRRNLGGHAGVEQRGDSLHGVNAHVTGS
mmetsp:Transcript_20811/g.67428  ORF Transcript_20811/g.67428 Transcript_20811/m.67428 type:complete len:256 (-) Transcript_20811:1554-2321(-)